MTVGKTVKRLVTFADRNLEQLNDRLGFAQTQAHAGDAKRGIHAILRPLESSVMGCPDKLALPVATLAPIVEQAIRHEERGRNPGDPTSLSLVRIGDAMNAIEIAGGTIEPAARAAVLDWFRHTTTKRRAPEGAHWYWTTVFGVLALDMTPSSPMASKIEAGVTFESDLEGLSNYLREALAANASFEEIRPAWEDVVAYTEALHEAELASPGTLLWIARVVYHRIGGIPLGNVAQRFHDDLWKLARVS